MYVSSNKAPIGNRILRIGGHVMNNE